MRIGDEYVLDPIHITGEGPKGKGIFADTSYSDLPAAESDGFSLRPKASGLLLLAVLGVGVYLAVRE